MEKVILGLLLGQLFSSRNFDSKKHLGPVGPKSRLYISVHKIKPDKLRTAAAAMSRHNCEGIMPRLNKKSGTSSSQHPELPPSADKHHHVDASAEDTKRSHTGDDEPLGSKRRIIALGDVTIAVPVGTPKNTFHRCIYDAHQETEETDFKLKRDEGEKDAEDSIVNVCYGNLGSFHTFMRDTMGHDTPFRILAAIHFSTDFYNATFDNLWLLIGDGSKDRDDARGIYIDNLARAMDILSHEATHQLISFLPDSCPFNNLDDMESRCIAESICDVLGVLTRQHQLYGMTQRPIDDDYWLLGADVICTRQNGVGLRSLKSPGHAFKNHPILGDDKQAARRSEFDPNEDSHYNCGIANHAFYLFVMNLGEEREPWKRAGGIWFKTLLDSADRKGHVTFISFAMWTLEAAKELFPETVEHLMKAWNDVGVPVEEKEREKKGDGVLMEVLKVSFSSRISFVLNGFRGRLLSWSPSLLLFLFFLCDLLTNTKEHGGRGYSSSSDILMLLHQAFSSSSLDAQSAPPSSFPLPPVVRIQARQTPVFLPLPPSKGVNVAPYPGDYVKCTAGAWDGVINCARRGKKSTSPFRFTLCGFGKLLETDGKRRTGQNGRLFGVIVMIVHTILLKLYATAIIKKSIEGSVEEEIGDLPSSNDLKRVNDGYNSDENETPKKRARQSLDAQEVDLFSLFEKSPIPDYTESLPVPRSSIDGSVEPTTPTKSRFSDLLSSLRNHRKTPNGSDEKVAPKKNEEVFEKTPFPKPIIIEDEPISGEWPPWVVAGNPCTLDEEIDMFQYYMHPTQNELDMRADLIRRLQRILITTPHQKLIPFGSYPSNIFLPYSDLDFVLEEGSSRRKIYYYSSRLESSGEFDEILSLPKARVPIIKAKDIRTGISIDISFNQSGGLENTRIVQEAMEKVPELKPLVMVLKYFLQQRQLNDPATGGLGSYATVLMTISFLQRYHDNYFTRPQKPGLGQLLIDFFDFYGRRFNYWTTGISIRNGGTYFNKSDYGWASDREPWQFCVEDPQDEDNNVTRSCRGILIIRDAFVVAHCRMMSYPTDNSHKTHLSTIYNVTRSNNMEDIRRKVRDFAIQKKRSSK
ncbi:PAP-associated domain-containing protein 5-like [Planoprotostelium fungivorum]|uniref:PAP-associated domain-containing protein 5-like n=1 Tax=Planoprotostelium fungivorum TaxID=1890364 RepID=A0A2P6NY28_9EUKA|nr:PAP-associated domain-containing protein 5-like [Planoprotostelium fungivorum]